MCSIIVLILAKRLRVIKIKKRVLVFMIICVGTILCAGCYANVKSTPEDGGEIYTFSRNMSALDYSGLKFDPWDVGGAAEGLGEQETKPYTVMIYMNGSDLESENGAATLDILEMLSSGVDTDIINVILFTGGAYKWQNSVIPPRDCVIWRLEDGEINKIASVGLRNMGDAGTLSSFVEFCLRYYPAEKSGLVLWDHGGGSIAGYGHDELFDDGCLTLLEIDYAFRKSGLSESKLEFLGFDACLMATVEMAVVASDYARYLVASEDLEPGDGWDYKFLAELGKNPSMEGEELCRVITDYYADYYGNGTVESVTMSVVNLEYAGDVMGAMGALMGRCESGLAEEGEAAFNTLARRRYRTKTFGTGTRRDGDCDMVDIGDMAEKLSDIFPEEAAALRGAILRAVIYNRHNSRSRLSGLTAYYIFGGKNDAENALAVYSALNMSPEYTGYLKRFAGIMTEGSEQSGNSRASGGENSGGILNEKKTLWKPVDGRFCMVGQMEEDGDLWPVIGGKYICMKKIGETLESEEYAVPALINGVNADVIISLSDEYPDGKILGTRREEGFIIQKGLDKIYPGDEIAFFYETKHASKSEWVLSDSIIAGEHLELEWREPDSGPYYVGILTTNERLEKHISRYESISAD